MLGKTEGRKRRGQKERMRWLDDIANLMDMSLSKLDGHEFEQTRGDGEGQGSLECWERVRQELATEQQQIFPLL